MNIITFIKEHFGPIKTNVASSSYERKPFNKTDPVPEIIKIEPNLEIINGPFITGSLTTENFASYACSGYYILPCSGLVSSGVESWLKNNNL